jgi:hypothetical protein
MMNLGLIIIKYLLLWRFSLFLLKDKLGHPIPSREHSERNDWTKDKCSYRSQVVVVSR